jgi:hypothetical protein
MTSSTSSAQKSRLLLSCLEQDVIRNIIHPMLGTSLSCQMQLLCEDLRCDLSFTLKTLQTKGWKLRAIKECLEKGYPSPHGKRKFGIGDKRLPYHPLIALQAHERSTAILAFATCDKPIPHPRDFNTTETEQLETHYAAFAQFVKDYRGISLEGWLGAGDITIPAYAQWVKTTISPTKGKMLPSGGFDKRLLSYIEGRRFYREIFYKKYCTPVLFPVFEQLYTHANTIFDDIIQKTDRTEEEKKEEA